MRDFYRIVVLVMGLVWLMPHSTAWSAPENVGKSALDRKRKRRKKKKKKPRRYEFAILPALAGSVDTGFGFGIIANLARFEPGYNPYRWRIEAQWYMTVLEAPGGGFEFPFHDDYILIDLPGLAGGKLRLDMRVSFGRFTTAGYFGLGNASNGRPVWNDFDPETQKDQYIEARRRYQYDWVYPNARVNARVTITKHLLLFLGAEFSYNFLNLYKNSKLEEDLKRTQDTTRQDDETNAIRGLLHGIRPHANFQVKAGLVYDTRDHEQVPSKGMFHDVSLRVSPGPVFSLQYPYGGATLHFRFFFPLYKEFLVLAVRVLGDFMFGRVPIYDLATFGGIDPREGTGGSRSIRGIPSRRYHGKIKLLGNLELRALLIPVRINFLGQRFNVGLVGFFDTGRFWADYQYNPALDGEGDGMHFGFGGGLRILWGESFIIRADFAYSLDEYSTFRFYIGVNQIF